jgi:hypothetical protein
MVDGGALFFTPPRLVPHAGQIELFSDISFPQRGQIMSDESF